MKKINYKMMCLCFKKCLIILVLYFITINTNAQQQDTSRFSINPKFGFFFLTEDIQGYVLGTELNFFLKNNFLFSFDFYRHKEFFLSPSPGEYYYQLGLMFGKTLSDKFVEVQYQAGIAPFWGLDRTTFIKPGMFGGSYDSEQFITLGLVTKLSFKIVPLRFLSVGLDLQSNINKKKVAFIPLFSIGIGHLRDKK